MKPVGIINCYKSIDNIVHVLQALQELGHDCTVVDAKEVSSVLPSSPIRHWIGTGSEYDVHDVDAPRISETIANYTEKRFLLICYSMQSFLVHAHNCTITRMPSEKQAHECLHFNSIWRNHKWAFKPFDIASPSFSNAQVFDDGYVASLECQNILMTQYHPERTRDGIESILNPFLKS